MEIHVDDKTKIVSIWLTNSEKKDVALKARLKPLYQDYKARKYTVAVFESGDRELYQSALDLLAYNKKRIAELDTQREKAIVPEERTSVRTQLRAMKPTAKPAPPKAKQREYSR